LRTNSTYARRFLLALAAVAAVGVSACRQDMHDQPKLEPLEGSDFFSDRRASRPSVDGTVARGELREDVFLYTGFNNGELATEFPFPVTRDVVERGQHRFNIYCSPCHGLIGDGLGAVVQRGFQRPPSYHIERLRAAPVGHFYNVITHGKGRMYSFNDRIPPDDRWAIASYIRALQLSRQVDVNDLPPAVVAELNAEAAQ
jgi:Cytochrome C oxidase, cbb3-type, subunit III